MICSLVNSQTITFKGCVALFENQDFTFNNTGVDATGRNIFVTTPTDGQACGGLGTCEFKLQWSVANTRWEFLADEGAGTLTAPYMIYNNSSASTPNPPSLTLGAWIENTSLTTGLCGGNLSAINTTFNGAVQNTILGNDKFSISSGIIIYPNPTTSILNIKSNIGIDNISVWNILGQKVLECNTASTIDISGLQAGMYLARFETENGIKVTNFIKK